MSDAIFHSLGEVIHEDFRMGLDGNRLTLSEKQHEGKNGNLGRFVTLHRSGKVFAFSLDVNGPDALRFFTLQPGLRKKNDAIIFCMHCSKIYVLFVELKSGSPSGYIKQLQSGMNFVNYLRETIALHFNVRADVEYRAVVFSTERKIPKARSNRKTPTAKYEDVDGIKITKADCNREYSLEQFLQ